MIRRENGTLFVGGAPYRIGCDAALERAPQLSRLLRRHVGDRFVMLLGLRGGGKTTVARRLDASGLAVRVPIRVTRALRADEETYQRATGVRELISVSVDEFRKHRDYLAVGHYGQSYYGLSFRDLLEAYEEAQRRGPAVKILLASGNARHTVLAKETFPLARAVLLSVGSDLRQARVDRDTHRPPPQRVAIEDDDEQSMTFFRATADVEISNEDTIEETAAALARYLDEMTALRDEVVLSGERAHQLHGFIDALSQRRIPCAVFAGFAVLLYTKNRKATDIDILVPDIEEAARAVRFELLRDNDDQWGTPFPHAEVWGPARVTRAGNTYAFGLTDEMVASRHIVELPGGRIPLVRPEDIVVLKAILQRGQDVGKYDREDIVALDKHYHLDIEYIHRRARELACEQLALPYLDGVLT